MADIVADELVLDERGFVRCGRQKLFALCQETHTLRFLGRGRHGETGQIIVQISVLRQLLAEVDGGGLQSVNDSAILDIKA